ncbi:MAG TPA: prepilin-type N-terminal cleavage/methylation domain-containing protein [Candidatus Ozemobacteraceae bacterium]|nr:prepilin-type N-terminal cleavage/methylation domain-containing protein [Candidatus Ozemobacteraceae bacterium]
MLIQQNLNTTSGKKGFSLIEILVVSLLLLMVGGMIFFLSKNLSASKTSLTLQNSFQNICSTAVENIKQDLYSARKLTLGPNEISLERYTDIQSDGNLKTEKISYRFEPPFILMNRNGVERKTDFSELLSTAKGNLEFSLTGKKMRDEPNDQEAVVDISIKLFSKDRKPVEILKFYVSLVAKTREGLLILPPKNTN